MLLQQCCFVLLLYPSCKPPLFLLVFYFYFFFLFYHFTFMFTTYLCIYVICVFAYLHICAFTLLCIYVLNIFVFLSKTRGCIVLLRGFFGALGIHPNKLTICKVVHICIACNFLFQVLKMLLQSLRLFHFFFLFLGPGRNIFYLQPFYCVFRFSCTLYFFLYSLIRLIFAFWGYFIFLSHFYTLLLFLSAYGLICRGSLFIFLFKTHINKKYPRSWASRSWLKRS